MSKLGYPPATLFAVGLAGQRGHSFVAASPGAGWATQPLVRQRRQN